MSILARLRWWNFPIGSVLPAFSGLLFEEGLERLDSDGTVQLRGRELFDVGDTNAAIPRES